MGCIGIVATYFANSGEVARNWPWRHPIHCCIMLGMLHLLMFEEQLAEHLLLAGRNCAAGCFVAIALVVAMMGQCSLSNMAIWQYGNGIDFDLSLFTRVHY